MSIQDQVILITGATSIIGRRLAEEFAGRGASLALCVRRMDAVDPTDRELLRRGITAFVAPCDLRYEEDVVRMIHRVVRRYGRIDVVINAGAILGPREPVIDYEVDPWRNVMATNVTGPFLVCREVLPWMMRQRFGRIINVTTSLTRAAKPQWGAYLVSNHAVEGLTRLLATEIRQTNIRVNCVDVGMPLIEGKSIEWNPAFLPVFEELMSPDCPHNGERFAAGELSLSEVESPDAAPVGDEPV